MNLDLQNYFSDPIIILVLIVSLDLFFGDPIYPLHPVKIIGRLQLCYENQLRKIALCGKIGGIILAVFTIISTLLFFNTINYLLSLLHWSLAWIWSIYVGWSLIALRDLLTHSNEVAEAIGRKNLKEARKRVSKIVGRETKKMDINACGRATVESVSENLNDGVIAPLFYFCFFGLHGMIIYKVFNTLDSMIGYKNKKYIYFGWFAARIDDLLNWIPSRCSWILISLTAAMFRGFSGVGAFKIGLRDYSKLSSPNAGWCEASAAGALKIKLCGPIWREGKLAHDFWLGDSCEREGANSKDIFKMNQLALRSSLFGALFFGVCLWFFRDIPFFGL